MEKGESGSIRHSFLPFTIEGYSAKIQSGGILIRNRSNFRGDLDFAWEITEKGADEGTSGSDEGISEGRTRFRQINEIFLPLHEGGTYEIRAITRQQSDGVTRVTPILTISYDAGLDKTVIYKAAECVAVE